MSNFLLSGTFSTKREGRWFIHIQKSGRCVLKGPMWLMSACPQMLWRWSRVHKHHPPQPRNDVRLSNGVAYIMRCHLSSIVDIWMFLHKLLGRWSSFINILALGKWCQVVTFLPHSLKLLVKDSDPSWDLVLVRDALCEPRSNPTEAVALKFLHAADCTSCFNLSSDWPECIVCTSFLYSVFFAWHLGYFVSIVHVFLKSFLAMTFAFLRSHLRCRR